MIDEVVAEDVYVNWIKPIQASDDPCETIMEILLCLSSEKTQEELACGCPLNNLAQEMSPLDEGFRTRIKAIYDRWIAAIADAFERAKSKGKVRGDLEPDAAALMVVAMLQGLIGLIKTSRTSDLRERGRHSLKLFLDSLKA